MLALNLGPIFPPFEPNVTKIAIQNPTNHTHSIAIEIYASTHLVSVSASVERLTVKRQASASNRLPFASGIVFNFPHQHTIVACIFQYLERSHARYPGKNWDLWQSDIIKHVITTGFHQSFQDFVFIYLKSKIHLSNSHIIHSKLSLKCIDHLHQIICIR